MPGDLQYKERDSMTVDELMEDEDIFATVLYNDEVVSNENNL